MEKKHAYGMVVFIGRPIKENDLFAKIVDLGVRIPDVDNMLLLLCQYVEKLGSLHIGNVVQIQADPKAEGGFEFALIAKTPLRYRR